MEDLTKKLTEAIGLSDLRASANEKPSIEDDLSFPEWSKSPHSEVSHLALTVGALCKSFDELGSLKDRPGQAILVSLPSQLDKHRAVRGLLAEIAPFRPAEVEQTTQPESPGQIAPSRDLLRKHFDIALAELSALRGVEGTHGDYARQTHDCVFEAGVRAVADGAADILTEVNPFCEWRVNNPQPFPPNMYVVHTGPGSGKTTAAKALMVALVRATEASRCPLGCVLLVHHVETAAHAYHERNTLLPGRVRVWTKEHDLECGYREPKCATEDLQQYPLIIVTHAFYQNARGDLARGYAVNGASFPRVLTFIDEKINEVDTYSVSYDQIASVSERIRRDEQYLNELDETAERLMNFAFGKRHGPDLETPTQDPEGWRVAEQLHWFTTDDAMRYQRSQSARWKAIEFEDVFGFARAVTRRRAFIARSNKGKRGTTFLGYEGVPRRTIMPRHPRTCSSGGGGRSCPWR